MSFLRDSVPRRCAGIEVEAFGDQAVMLDASGTVARGLNATAVKVWSLIDGQRTVAEIAQALEVDADAALVEADVLVFLSALEARELIE